jgi:hypothetical protein
MKRYTGQKALYEAISRSRAKAKRGNILERFLPEVSRPEEPAPPEGQSQTEPIPAPPAAPEPAAKESPRPLPEKEKPREPVVVRENAKLRRLAAAERVEMPPEKSAAPIVRPRPIEKMDRLAAPLGLVQAWWRLKPVQLNAGRVEISIPYHIGIVVVLVVALLVLTAFRLGQKHPGAKAKADVPTKTAAQTTPQNATKEGTAAKASEPALAAAAPAGSSAKKEGDHWLVLVKHKNEVDLEEVVKYFGQNGIDLTIVPLPEARKAFAERGLNAAILPNGNDFLLVTSKLYSNPKSPDTEGYAEKQKIVELGRKYKAPAGREKFAPNYFRDAYWMKITK